MANFETQLLLNLNELEFDTSRELTVEEIKSRYKKLSLHYHPDLNNNEIFRDKQKKINSAKEFLLDNLDEINRYIRRINHNETDDDKARAEKEQWQRDEQARRAYYEQQARQKQASAQAEQEKARAEQEKAKAEQEKAKAEQKARNAEREAAEAKARAEAAESIARAAERARRESESKKNLVTTVIVVIALLAIAIPIIIGAANAFITGFNEARESDKQSEAAADKEARTVRISDTNLPSIFVKGVNISWSDYYVTYKDKDGKDVKVTLSDDIVSIDYENFEEQKIEINVNNGSVYLYHKLTILDSTLISSVEGLKAIANDPKGTYLLDADIDLSGTEWTPIASLEGRLIGNGHTIKNLTITNFTTKNIGLFGKISNKATVSDLKFENVLIKSMSTADSIGALAGISNGTVKNITVTGTIDSVASNYVGGIIGTYSSENGKIENCAFDGKIIGNQCVGGILGGGVTDFYVSDCTSNGNITGMLSVGGIVGTFDNDYPDIYTIKNCKNTASITSKTDYAGGIIGKLYTSSTPQITLTGCINEGKITGKQYTGGIAGSMIAHAWGFPTPGATINTLTNKGAITGTSYTGGITGAYIFSNALTSLENSASVKGEAYVGGLVGYSKYGAFTGLTNQGNASGSYYVGGICGYVEYAAVSNCTNNGNISATLIDTEKNIVAVGGICGRTDNIADGCINNGSVTSKSGASVGGIIGISENNSYEDRKYTNCKNNGRITIAGGMSDGVGGIIGTFVNRNGYSNVTLSIVGCENTGEIIASSGKAIGGIIGCCKTNDKMSIVSCSSTANITATNCEAVGGILGIDSTSNSYRLAKIEFITVTGKVQGKSSVGSIIGLAKVAPENYGDIKSTYTIENNNDLAHIGAIAE